MNEMKTKLEGWRIWLKESGTKSVLHCAGACVSGPDRVYFFMTIIIILIPAILFCVRVLPYLITNVGNWCIVFAVVFGILIIICLGSLLKTGLSDPGIVPRSPEWKEKKENWFDRPPQTKEAIVMGQKITLKFCDTCLIYRSPRMVHCSQCDNCVADFDHHCPWVGNCIGRRNYRDFFVFLLCTMICLVLADCICILHLAYFGIHSDETTGGGKFLHILKAYPDILVLVVLLTLVCFPVGMLFFFHVSLVFSGKTTNETIKSVYYEQKGERSHCNYCLYQAKRILCRPMPPSFVGGLGQLEPSGKQQRTSLPELLGITVVTDKHCDSRPSTLTPQLLLSSIELATTANTTTSTSIIS